MSLSQKYDFALVAGVLLSIYLSQGLLYPSGSIISQGVLLSLLLIGVCYFVRTLLYKGNVLPIVAYLCFYLLVAFTFIVSPKVVYGWRYEAIGKVETFGQFKDTCVFVLSFFIGYYAGLRKGVSDKNLFVMGCLYLLVSIATFFYLRNQLLVVSSADNVVNNAAYRLIAFIPFLPICIKFTNSKLLGITIIVVLTMLVIMGAKRGAIVCLVLSFLFGSLYYIRHVRMGVHQIVGAAIIGVSLLWFILFLIGDNDFLMNRLSRSQTVGIGPREIAYKVLWNYWNFQSSNWEYLIGGGSCASIRIWGNYAHNDWLELLSSNGLLGVLLYAVVFISFAVSIHRLRIDFLYKLSMYLCLLIWFLKSCFSMGYTGYENGIFMILLGALFGGNQYKSNSL